MTFASLGLIDPLLRMLDTVGYTTPTPVQKQAIPAVLAGRDLMAAAQTGTGKTGGFAIPLLQRLMEGERAEPNQVRCLVLVPTRELAEQVYESFRSYGRNVPMRCHVAYGGVPIEPQIAKLNKGLDVMVATPGRLLDLYRQGAVQFEQLESVVLDEADRMLDLGFAADLEAILLALPDEHQTLMFSATYSDDVRSLAEILLNDPVSISVSPRNAAAKSVKQWIVTTDKAHKPELFLHLLKKQRWGQVLVFVKTRKGVDALVKTLAGHGVSTDSIHGDKPQPARLRALARFKASEVQVLVATDVAARGLDIEALPLVVNFDLPTVAEDYVHRIGRTGRAGAEGVAISLVCADEVDLLSAIEKLTRQVLRREEEPGFEADHRVPETGTPKPPAKEAAGGKKKRPFTGPPGGKAAQGPKMTQAAPSGGKPHGAGGAAGATRSGPAGKAGKGGAPAAKVPAPGSRGSNAAALRAMAEAAGGRSAGQGQGKVIVAGGRGAKSAARAEGRAQAIAPSRKTGRGSVKR
ncbi:DEAD/DEAH box helicase [Massilia sp. Root418]|uniref:DEAD/DEAH box helicase n=1 Tax=Massilia sp. Root418 TaxID=1736532 RepID=UPI0006F7500E|nr:DEAD/DEAH box helicase [Massilia sp. Root418]KQX01750.1 DEAD/DEAH box helicase [Massilia sp. Root418]